MRQRNSYGLADNGKRSAPSRPVHSPPRPVTARGRMVLEESRRRRNQR